MKILYLILISFFIASCNEDVPRVHSFKGEIMGTYYSVKINSLPIKNEEELSKDIKQYLQYVNSIFSTYNPGSELSILNKIQDTEQIRIDDELKFMLIESKEISESTDGYFDITVGPIVNLWGFGPTKNTKTPTDKAIAATTVFVGMNKYTIDNEGHFRKKHPKLYLDLSAIAKGQGVDMLSKFLWEKGFKDSLVEIGGEVKAFGQKAKGTPWKIGIEKIGKDFGSTLQGVLKLENMSLATSGSYRNFKLIDGKSYSHTINPKTLRPTSHNLISVSVLHKDCSKADAYATAFMAMGEEKAQILAKKEGIAAYFMILKNDKIEVKTSTNFQDYILK